MPLVEIQTDPPYVQDEIPRTYDFDIFGKLVPEPEYEKEETFEDLVKDERDRGAFLDNIIRELVIRDLATGNKADEDVESIMGGPVSYALKAKGNAADMLTKAMGNFGLAKSLI